MATLKFVTDDNVLVNFPGFGYWPCRITRVISKNWRKVKYLGGREIGKAHVKVIREYDEDVKNDLEKYFSKRKQKKHPMLKLAVQQINKRFIRARNIARKTGDGKKQKGVSDKKKNTRKKEANNKNNNNVVLRSASFSEGTSTNNNCGLDMDAGSRNSSTTENIHENRERKSNAKETCTKSSAKETYTKSSVNETYTKSRANETYTKSNAKETYTKITPPNVSANTLSQLNSALFSAVQKSNAKVLVHEPVPELQIIDVPKNSTLKKVGEFKLVSSNVYQTCACQGMCQTDSCACVGYLEECAEACQCSDNCSNMGLTVGEGKRLFLAASEVHGTGCFANEDVKEGEFIGEYVGEIVSKFHAKRKRNRSKFLFLTGDKNFVIDASRFGSKLTRMNHKDENSGENCEFKLRRVRGAWRVGVWALQDISQGVELFADYGDQYWD